MKDDSWGFSQDGYNHLRDVWFPSMTNQIKQAQQETGFRGNTMSNTNTI